MTRLQKAAGRIGAGTTCASALTALVCPALLREGACRDAKAEPAEHVKMIRAGLSGPSLAFSSMV